MFVFMQEHGGEHGRGMRECMKVVCRGHTGKGRCNCCAVNGLVELGTSLSSVGRADKPVNWAETIWELT